MGMHKQRMKRGLCRRFNEKDGKGCRRVCGRCQQQCLCGSIAGGYSSEAPVAGLGDVERGAVSMRAGKWAQEEGREGILALVD